mmetsp:Transcript_39085/g.93802  ORF Transcript_39085/g.93802 Transcript_39085/m.93802 type:complete len:283 (-) Transcript_39085:1047-1895(-)
MTQEIYGFHVGVKLIHNKPTWRRFSMSVALALSSPAPILVRLDQLAEHSIVQRRCKSCSVAIEILRAVKTNRQVVHDIGRLIQPPVFSALAIHGAQQILDDFRTAQRSGAMLEIQRYSCLETLFVEKNCAISAPCQSLIGQCCAMRPQKVRIRDRLESLGIVDVSGQHRERMFRGIHGVTFTVGAGLAPGKRPSASLFGLALPRGVRVQIMKGNATIIAFVAVQMSPIAVIQEIVHHELDWLILNVTTNIDCAQARDLHQLPLQHIQILCPERECINMLGVE